MGLAESFRSAEQVAAAIDRLAMFASSVDYSDLPDSVRDRLQLMITDLFGVTVAGARTPELRALVDAWRPPDGDVLVPGTQVRTAPESSAYLSAIAACVLELDEGNKYAAGHPAAHVVFAAMAAARLSQLEVSGPQFLTAVAVGYEVAARFGRATSRRPEWHTHGHWGATGAAAASALLLGGDQAQVAGAIDAATGLMLVTPWSTVLAGDFTRNLWLAQANSAGLNAARLAVAGLVHDIGAAQYSLGEVVGTLDAESLVSDLGDRWLAGEGYLKRHSSCSYTHAAVDLVQSLRNGGTWQVEDVAAVRVATHSLASTLTGRHPGNRLSAMFSLPFVVSNAIVNGSVDPATMRPGSAQFHAAEAFSERVSIDIDPGLDAYLPDLRCTEVTIEFVDGTWISLGQPNPIGDAHYFPLSADDVDAKLTALIGDDDTRAVRAMVDALPTARSATAVLDG